jgi:hypothetical protein
LKTNINKFISEIAPDIFDAEFNLGRYINYFKVNRGRLRNFDQLARLHRDYETNLRAEARFLNDESDESVGSDDHYSSNSAEGQSESDTDAETDSKSEESDNGSESENINETQITLGNILRQLDVVKQIEFHKMVASHQRDAYNRMTTQISYYNDSILIEMDFKQKIVFGRAY